MVLTVLLAACGGSGSERSTATTSRSPADDQSSSPRPFPVRIEHKYGTTEIPEEPHRVVTIGYQEHDPVIALGVAPVAVRYWFGDETDVIFPWAEDEAGNADPAILNMAGEQVNFEAVAALDPDLILGIYSGIKAEEYEKLSAIAPTVAQTGNYVDFGVPWQETTRTIGRALGRAEQADALVASVEARFDAVRRDHPELHGLGVAVATYQPDEIGFFASQDPRSRFFTALGLEVPPALDDIAGDLFYGTLSRERIALLDTDVLVWDQMAYVDGGRATVEADPLVAQLDAAREDRVLFLEGEVEEAFAFNTVLSLPFVLDRVVPELVAVATRAKARR